MTAAQERILALVREFNDIEGVVKIKSMPDLGRWLRANGLPDLARRVSRASKGRNIQAHPDVTLDAELRRALVSRSLCDVTDSNDALMKLHSPVDKPLAQLDTLLNEGNACISPNVKAQCMIDVMPESPVVTGDNIQAVKGQLSLRVMSNEQIRKEREEQKQKEDVNVSVSTHVAREKCETEHNASMQPKAPAYVSVENSGVLNQGTTAKLDWFWDTNEAFFDALHCDAIAERNAAALPCDASRPQLQDMEACQCPTTAERDSRPLSSAQANTLKEHDGAVNDDFTTDKMEVSGLHDEILAFLQDEGNCNANGAAFAAICSHVEPTSTDVVRDVLGQLVMAGLVYTTFDEEHFLRL